jgi:predicted transcriptional regulator
MSAKQLFLKTVREMSDKATIEQIVEKLAILAALRRGEEAAEQGMVVSHHLMKKCVQSWKPANDITA